MPPAGIRLAAAGTFPALNACRADRNKSSDGAVGQNGTHNLGAGDEANISY